MKYFNLELIRIQFQFNFTFVCQIKPFTGFMDCSNCIFSAYHTGLLLLNPFRVFRQWSIDDGQFEKG